MGEAATDTVNWTSSSVKSGAGYVYESASNTMGAVSNKLDETGFTEKAGQAAKTAAAAGTVVYTAVNAKIEENPTLANMKTKAAENASYVAGSAAQAASKAADSITNWWSWARGGSQQQAAAATEETKE